MSNFFDDDAQIIPAKAARKESGFFEADADIIGPDEAEKGGRSPFPSAETPSGALEVLYKILDTPSAALRSGIGALQEPGDFGDKFSGAGSAALEQLIGAPGTKKAPSFADIMNKGAQSHGITPEYQEEVSRVLGPVYDATFDPLNATPNFIGAGVKTAGQVKDAVSVAKGLKDMVPEGAFFKVAEEVPKRSLKDRAVTTLFGPGEEAIAAYKKSPELINKAVGVEGIKDVIDGSVKKISNVVKAKEAGLAQAKSDWDNAFNMRVEELRSARPPSEMRGEVLGAIESLKAEVSQQSSDAFSILEEAGVTIPTARLKAGLQVQINQMKATPKITPQGRAAVSRLEEIRNNMDELPGELTGTQAKEIIQELDAARQASMRAGEYFDKEEQIKQLFRGSIDAKLKEVPAYKEAMAKLSDDTRLLKDASARLGDERQLITRLNQIGSGKGGPDAALLQKLSDRTGLGIMEQVKSYESAQRLLKDKNLLNQMRDSLPEAANYIATKEDFDLADETAQMFLSRLGPNSSENAVKSALAGRNIETMRAMSELEKQTGVPLDELLQAERLKKSFSGGRTNGSRSVTVGGDMGEAFGSLAQQAMESGMRNSPVGRALGSVYFAYVDKYGGEMAKKVIDQEIAVKTAAMKFNGIKAPAKAIQKNWVMASPQLVKEILRPDAEVDENGEILVTDPAIIQEARSAVSSSDEMSNIDKAKLLNSITKSGELKIKIDRPKQTKEQAQQIPEKIDIRGLNEMLRKATH